MFPLNPYNYNPFANSNFSDPLSVFRLNFPLTNAPSAAAQGPAGPAGKAGAPGAPGGAGPAGAPGAPGAPAPAPAGGTPSVTSTVGYPGVGGVDPNTGLPLGTDTGSATSTVTYGWGLDPNTGNPVYNPPPPDPATQGGYIDTTGGYLTTVDPYFGVSGAGVSNADYSGIMADSGMGTS